MKCLLLVRKRSAFRERTKIKQKVRQKRAEVKTALE